MLRDSTHSLISRSGRTVDRVWRPRKHQEDLRHGTAKQKRSRSSLDGAESARGGPLGNKAVAAPPLSGAIKEKLGGG